jgi:hypothetical protein
MTPIMINMNATVTVLLNDYGKKILRDHYAEFGCVPWNADENPRRMQLWEVAHVFGPCMYNGNPDVPFVNNSIALIDDGL